MDLLPISIEDGNVKNSARANMITVCCRRLENANDLHLLCVIGEPFVDVCLTKASITTEYLHLLHCSLLSQNGFRLTISHDTFFHCTHLNNLVKISFATVGFAAPLVSFITFPTNTCNAASLPAL